jgi:hypothetical protein
VLEDNTGARGNPCAVFIAESGHNAMSIAPGMLEPKNSLLQWGNHFFYSINQARPAIIPLQTIVTLV